MLEAARLPAAAGGRTDVPLQWGIGLLAVVLVLFPLAPILYQSVLARPLYEPERVLSLENYARVLASREFHAAAANSLAAAGATVVLAVGLGTLLAVLVMRTDLPLRGLLGSLVMSPLYISPLVLAFAWVTMFGPQGYVTIALRAATGAEPWNLYSLPGIVAVSIFYYAPIAYLNAVASLSLSDPTVEDAARVAGASPLRVLATVTLPLLRPAVTYSALLVGISSLELLSIPLILGTPSGIDTLATLLVKLGVMGGRPDYGGVAAVAVILLAVVTLLILVQERLIGAGQRFVTVRGKAVAPRPLAIGPLRVVALALGLAYVLLGVVVPLVGILLRSVVGFLSPLANPLDSLTLEHYALVFQTESYRRSVTNSLLIAGVGGGAGILFMTLLALVAYRSELGWRRMLGFVALYPRAIPGLIVGIGFLWSFLLIPRLGGLRNTVLALAVAFIMRYIPYGFSIIAPTLTRVSRELDSAARVCGDDWTGTVRRVLLPVLRPAILTGWVLLFITFLKEYSSAVFLFARGSEVMGTTMLELWRQGDMGPVSVLAALQVLLILAVTLVMRYAFGVRFHG
ncbi:MAG: iron ABC transporter permease [Armatimonadota bacterium]|nr:iron ABC transporter permease [Armatimonadota bacterium]